MIVEFTVENWKSYKDEMIFNMVAGNITECEHNYIRKSNIDILKTAVLYGANASGKSNLIKAVGFFISYIFEGNSGNNVISESGTIQRDPFALDINSKDKPTKMEMVFVTKNERMYRYGFIINDEEVIEEWLEECLDDDNSFIYKRENDKLDLSGIDLSSAKISNNEINNNILNEMVSNITKPSMLVLTNLSKLNIEVINSIIDFLKKVKVYDGARSIFNSEDEKKKLTNNKAYKNKFLALLKCADLGIDDVRIAKAEPENEEVSAALKQLPKNVRSRIESELHMYITEHDIPGNEDVKCVAPAMAFESDGTLKIMNLSPSLISSIENGEVLLIDELDSTLHPVLLRFIVKLFNYKEATNGSQLIFTAQDTSLLESDSNGNCLRRDQIWFVEKKSNKSSDLYSLYDFKTKDGDKKVRKDENYAKNYIRGKYQAVPMIKENEYIKNFFIHSEGERDNG